MKATLGSLVGLAIFSFGYLGLANSAAALTPAECTLYARAFAADKTVKAPPGTTASRSRQEIQDEAYARCREVSAARDVAPRKVAVPKRIAKPVMKVAKAKVAKARVAKDPKVVRIAAAPRVPKVPRVMAYAPGEPTRNTPAVRAISSVMLGDGPAPATTGPKVASACVPGRRAVFWRGLMTPNLGGSC